MHTPAIETLSSTPSHLRWFEDGLPYPVKVKTSSALVGREVLEQATLQQEFYCRLFNLEDAEQRQTYATIRQRGVDGWYEILNIQQVNSSTNAAPSVWMEWLQTYWEVTNDT